MIKRDRRWQEVQPIFKGRLGPSKAHLFKPASSQGLAPTDGIAPLADTPTEPGWWVCKQATAASPYLDYFSEADMAEQIAAGEDSQVAFYPYTPLLSEALRCKKMKGHAKTSGKSTSTGSK